MTVVATTAPACGGEKEATPSPSTRTLPPIVTLPAILNGVWTGAWRHTSGDTGEGTLRLEWSRVARVMRGRITITGWSCIDQGDVQGVVSGNNVVIDTVKGGTQVTYTGTLSDTSMSGTYETNCSSASGTWQLSKS